MKSIFLFLFGISIINNFSFAQDSTKWNSFRGIFWGTKICDINGPDVVVMENDKKSELLTFAKSNEKLSIGRADLIRILYNCYKQSFFSVIVCTEKKENFQYLKEAIFSYYGEGHQISEFIDEWQWDVAYSNSDKDIWINLKYNPFSEEGLFYIVYKPIMIQKLDDDKEKAKAAEHDFN